MKRIGLFLCILVAVLLILLSACSETTGYIVRYDIKIDEMEYFYKGTEPINEHLTMENIKKALGLPHGMFIDWRGITEYEYNTDFGVLYFVDYQEKDYYGIYADLSPGVEEPKSFGDRDITIDSGKYKMEKRFDISEDELSFINAEATPSELQEKLGAPHRMTYGLPENVGIGIYIYNLKNENIFKVAYSGYGQIYKAWVEDAKGNEKIYDCGL